MSPLKRVLRALTLCVFLSLMARIPSIAADKLPFVHPLFTDHMVLQRNVKSPVFGWTTPGAKVTVEINGKTALAVAREDGYWIAKIGPLPAGGPYELSITGPEHRSISDVLVGDVWLCSGQSNMEMGVGVTENGDKEIASANYPEIRLFRVPKVPSEVPLPTVDANWLVCSPETIGAGPWGGFSATAFYFAREIYRTQHVPIGLIESAWSGTVGEAWVSPQSIGKVPEFSNVAAQIARLSKDPTIGRYSREERMEMWYQRNDQGTKEHWESPTLDDSTWSTMLLPQEWGTTDLAEFDGIAWFRTSFTLSSDWDGKDLEMNLGPIDDIDTTYVNGTMIGSIDGWNISRKYTIPASLLRPGRNVVSIRIFDIAMGGGIYGNQDDLWVKSIGDASLKPISLAGNWSYKVGIDMKDADTLAPCDMNNPNTPTLLYNGMIAPLVPTAIKGAIWYQGEANVGRSDQYRTILSTLISDWRQKFSVGDFPFYFVQLAGFGPDGDQPADSVPWADLREMQHVVSKEVKNTGIAVAIDIGNRDDIHPKNKQEVGRRLSLLAQSLTYRDKKAICKGPEYRSVKIEGDKVRVFFNNVYGGLIAKGGRLEGFTIAGADGHLHKADAVIDGKTVVVSSPDIPNPVAVRYAWANTPLCNLYNKEGLPAVPFSSDHDSHTKR